MVIFSYKIVSKNQRKLKQNIVMYTYNLFDQHPEINAYLSKPNKKACIKPASLFDLFNIYHLQNHTYQQMVRDHEASLFEKSSFGELYHMYRKHMLYVKKNQYGLMGYVGIQTMSLKHTLSKFVKNPKQTMVLDTILTTIPYRGLGIQRELMDYVLSQKKFSEYQWVATVSPDNEPSLTNFMKAGFKIKNSHVTLYQNKERHVLFLSSYSSNHSKEIVDSPPNK